MTDSSPVNPRRAAEQAAQAAAAIRRAADGAADELAFLHAGLCAREAELQRLQEVCEDRQRVIDALTEHAATYRRAAEERAGLLAALDVDLGRLRDDLERVSGEHRAALAAAQEATRALDEERLQIRFTAQEREAELRAAHRDAEALRTRADGLESALVARANLIAQLHTACDERLAVIERLSAEVNGLRRVAGERGLRLDANDVDWRALAEERERALRQLAAEAERRSVLLAEVTVALEGRGREVEDLRKRLARTS
jgi:DNA repair exonuclease SbcCD ATPase subunit